MPDWKTADPDMVHEIVREAELRLQGQVTLATSADQRASVLAGIYTAAATAIAAGLISSAPGGGVSYAVLAGGIVAAIMFLVAAWLCISTALPAGFYLPGTTPEKWYKDIDNKAQLLPAMGQTAEHCQKSIAHNAGVLAENGRKFERGALIGIAAPLAGSAVWGIVALVTRCA